VKCDGISRRQRVLSIRVGTFVHHNQRLALVYIAQNFTSYLTENTVCVRILDQPVNVYGYARYLPCKLNETQINLELFRDSYSHHWPLKGHMAY